MPRKYHYEVLRAQVEAKMIQVPDGMVDQIQQIRNKFSEIEKDRIALRLLEEDGPYRKNNELHIAPTGHDIHTSAIFGRESEKEKLINLLSSKSHDNISVVTIVGTGGLGKTTLAQLAYNDQKIQKQFDEFGWVCVSVDFNIERLMRELVQSITGRMCGLTNISALQEEIKEVIKDKRILLILDDVWNEKRSLWELFHASFKSASFVKILVTTRNEHIARIMQTEPTFHLDYLSEEQCWQLFKHYAFGGVDEHLRSSLVEMGKQIVKKCGMLPLAVKSIASLLKHEMKEESWREILESELWESDASNEIFPSLQLSYERLPTHLKPCLVYCSMFPKDFRYDIEELVQLWISQGYVESKGMKNAQEIGWEYAKQLWQRSFFEGGINWNNSSWCKLHDMIHDLARYNSKNTCLSIDAGLANKLPDFSNELYHLCIADSMKLVESMSFDKFATLHTLIIMGLSGEDLLGSFDLSILQKLRALLIKLHFNKLEYFSSLGNLKHLRFLLLEGLSVERLPECICSLYNLNNLEIRYCNFQELPTRVGTLVSLERLIILDCSDIRRLPESLCQLRALKILVLEQCSKLLELPKNIGNLVSLETVLIKSCHSLKWLPESFGQFKALRKLKIYNCGVCHLPPNLGKIVSIQTLRVNLNCETIGWLKDYVDLGGALTLHGLENVCSLADVKCANLKGMHNMERLQLCWGNSLVQLDDDNRILLSIKKGQNMLLENRNDYWVMASLMPHPNLREVYIRDYGGISFPEWIGNPSSCSSLERIYINSCKNLKFLPFGSLHKLKYLKISICDSLLILRVEWLPLELEELQIYYCKKLSYVSGLQKLKSLVKLYIEDCDNLHWLLMDVEPSVEGSRMHENSPLGLRNLTLLRRLKIQCCPMLELLADELVCAESCEVQVRSSRFLKKWCLQHGIKYEDEAYYGDSEDETGDGHAEDEI